MRTYRAPLWGLVLLSLQVAGLHGQTVCQALAAEGGNVFVVLGCPEPLPVGPLTLNAGGSIFVSSADGSLTAAPHVSEIHSSGDPFFVDISNLNLQSTTQLNLLWYSNLTGSSSELQVTGCPLACGCVAAFDGASLSLALDCGAGVVDAVDTTATNGGVDWWVWLLVGLTLGLSVLTAVIAAVFLLRHRKRPHGPLPILDTFGLPEADGAALHWAQVDPFCLPETPTHGERRDPPASAASSPPSSVQWHYSPASTVFAASPVSDSDIAVAYPTPRSDYLTPDHYLMVPVVPTGQYSVLSTYRSEGTDFKAAFSARSLPGSSRYTVLNTARIQGAMQGPSPRRPYY